MKTHFPLLCCSIYTTMRFSPYLLLFLPVDSFLQPVIRHASNFQMRQRSSSTSPLCSSPSNDDDSTPLIVPEIVLEENPETAAARETQQNAYRTSGLVYGAATMDLWSKTGKMTSFSRAMLTSTTGAANVLAAVASYTLWGATKESRLTSDTYKRLNLSLAVYSTLMVVSGLASWKVVDPLPGVYCASSTLAAHTFAAVTCMGGYFKGARGLAPGSSGEFS